MRGGTRVRVHRKATIAAHPDLERSHYAGMTGTVAFGEPAPRYQVPVLIDGHRASFMDRELIIID